MGKWFLDFSFWIQSYRTAQTAHCAMWNIQAIMSPLIMEVSMMTRSRRILWWWVFKHLTSWFIGLLLGCGCIWIFSCVVHFKRALITIIMMWWLESSLPWEKAPSLLFPHQLLVFCASEESFASAGLVTALQLLSSLGLKAKSPSKYQKWVKSKQKIRDIQMIWKTNNEYDEGMMWKFHLQQHLPKNFIEVGCHLQLLHSGCQMSFISKNLLI